MYRQMANLIDSTVRSATYSGKVQKLRDGNGLYCHVMPSGKYWRYDYRYQQKRRTLALGVYPTVSLKQARIDLFAAKAKLADGIDPSYDKQLKKHVGDDDSFEAVAREWLDIQDWSARHRKTIELRIKKDLTPKIGQIPIQKIQAPDLLRVLRIIESRGAIETAHRVKTVASQIMRYGVATGRISSDPFRDLRGALKTPRTRRYAAIVKREPFGKLLRAIDGYDHSIIISHALRLAPHVALRPGELRGGLWSEIDIDNRVWTIAAERMKKKREHFIPLTNPMIHIIQSLHDYTGRGELMFPSIRARKRPISDGTLNAGLKYLGYSGEIHTPHGFRSTFSTMAYESGLFAEDVIEMQLAHLDKNVVKAAYNRSEHADQRRLLMEWWSSQINAMRQMNCSESQSSCK